jgi:hypothetical protein
MRAMLRSSAYMRMCSSGQGAPNNSGPDFLIERRVRRGEGGGGGGGTRLYGVQESTAAAGPSATTLIPSSLDTFLAQSHVLPTPARNLSNALKRPSGWLAPMVNDYFSSAPALPLGPPPPQEATRKLAAARLPLGFSDSSERMPIADLATQPAVSNYSRYELQRPDVSNAPPSAPFQGHTRLTTYSLT